MSITRTITCDACGTVAHEAMPNEGWSGWGGLQGVQINNIPNPQLCPLCLAKVAEYIDKEVFHDMD